MVYIYSYIYKFTIKCHSWSRLPHPQSRDSQGQEMFLAPSADKQIHITVKQSAQTTISPALSMLRSKGLSSCSKMKWWATPSSKQRKPWPGNVFSILCEKTCNYDTGYSNRLSLPPTSNTKVKGIESKQHERVMKYIYI